MCGKERFACSEEEMVENEPAHNDAKEHKASNWPGPHQTDDSLALQGDMAFYNRLKSFEC